LVLIVGWPAPPQQVLRSPGDLSLDERAAYQRAIKEVYWRHRTWPKENRAPKPMLDQVMPLSLIRAKVEDYLRKSEALGFTGNDRSLARNCRRKWTAWRGRAGSRSGCESCGRRGAMIRM
jgi:hypothetical protein